MSTQALAKNTPTVLNTDAVQKLIMQGDLAGLSPKDKAQYYLSLCEAIGLDPHTKPFDYLRLNGKEVLYANKNAAEQLRKVYAVSTQIVEEKVIRGVYVVKVRASMPDGRVDDSTGAVAIERLADGTENLANALMRAETKAKRRATLSICGLGMLDETEIESIKGAERIDEPYPIEVRTLPDEYESEQETASQSSDEGNGGGGSVSVTTDTEGIAGQPEPVAPKSGDVRDLKDNEKLAVFEVVLVGQEKPGKNGPFWGVKLRNGQGSDFWVNVFSSTHKETMETNERVAVIYTVNHKNGKDFMNPQEVYPA